VRTLRSTILAGVVPLLSVLGACGQQPAPPPLTQAQKLELDTLTGQLSDPARSAKTKLEAAGLLLNRPYPQAAEALRRFLADSTNVAAQQAVAEAIARHGGGQKVFIEPLMLMLVGAEPSVRDVAGRALATYKDHGVTERLIAISADSSRDRDLRLVTIRSLGLVLDKRAVEAMVALLEDSDDSIRAAAGESLAKLTNIRTFSDPGEWKLWWRKNKNKDRSEWLADLAMSLGKAKSALEAENARLRDRLARVTMELYASVPASRQETMLLGFLKDPLPDVRLVGTTITYRKLAASEAIGPEVRKQVRGMLGDADARLRRSSALLVASLGDGQALAALLERLSVEQTPSVRQGLLTAIGQLRDVKALPAVLGEIPSRDETIAAAAATALARIAEAQPLSRSDTAKAVKALIERYDLSTASSDGLALREALLTAMGQVGEAEFSDVLLDALGDSSAAVRQAAVNALAKLGSGKLAARIEPLTGDADRGVRQAAIAALGALGGKKHLQTILQRTNPAVEQDAAVRRQAWNVAMAILAKADPKTLRAVVDGLAGRPDARDQRIQILQMLVVAVSAAHDPAEGDVRRQLGLELTRSARPAEAEPQLAQAYRIYRQTDHPDAAAVWNEWIGALLAADDPAVIKVMDEQVDDECFAAALKQLLDRLDELKGQHKHSAVVILAQAAADKLPHRLTAAQRQIMEKLLAEARAAQKAQDREQVAKLLGQLVSADEAVRQGAGTQLQAMGDRATVPLLRELKKALAGDQPNSQAEAAILDIVGRIAPELNGYDPAAPKSDKLKRVDGWLEKLKP